MKLRLHYIFPVLICVILSAFLIGCDDLLEAASGSVSDGNGSGGGSGALDIPGGVGLTTASPSFNTRYVDGLTTEEYSGQPGMRISQLSQGEVNAAEITTQKTLGLWEDDKFHIEGFNTAFNGTYANAGFTDVSILYYNQPFAGDFKFSARVRILGVGGVSTGKGIHFGAYTPLEKPGADNPDKGILIEDGTGIRYPEFKPSQNSKGMGIFLRAEARPQFRLYYSSADNSTTAGTSQISDLIDLRLGKEYIYEITRSILPTAVHTPGSSPGANSQIEYKLAYGFKILDSKTGSPVRVHVNNTIGSLGFVQTLAIDAALHPVGGTSIAMHSALSTDPMTVYPGICISGSKAEISQIKVWTPVEDGGSGMDWDYGIPIYDPDDPSKIIGTYADGDDPIFKTPDTIPAYVPAESFNNPSFIPPKSVTVRNNENVFIWTSNTASSLNWTALANYNFKIQILPTVSPWYADENIRYEFFMITPEGADNPFSITGTDPYPEIPELPGREVYAQGIVSIDTDKIDPDATVSAQFKILARDLNLDIPGPDGIGSPDYSLLQTLPEYYFRIEVTRPELSLWP